MKKLVSVIVPAYNIGLYIEECIKSVINQTYPYWELIIIDDGSTDDTYEIIKKAAAADSRIQGYHQKNQGVSAARNTGLDLAQGSSIIFLDGDDFWLPECLERLVEAKNQSRVQASYCGYNHFYSNGFIRKYHYGYPGGDILHQFIKGEVHCHLGTMLIDKNIIEKYNLKFTEGCSIGEDLEFILKVAAVATFKSVSQNLLMYRVRPNSIMTSQWKLEKHIQGVEAMQRALEFIVDIHPHSIELDVIQAELIQRMGKLLSKLLWRTIKSYTYEDARALIDKLLADPFYASIENKFDKSCFHLLERLKYHIVLSKNQTMWNLVNAIYKRQV